jgi:hypothetical protein
VGSLANRIQDSVPTEQELWALAETEGFEQGEAIMQIKPDPSLPYCAAVYGTLGLDAIHIGVFEVKRGDDLRPWLRIRVFSEIEGPILKTCPVSLLDSVPPPEATPDSFSAQWRKSCRDFNLMSKVSGGNSARIDVLRNLAGDGRLVISHIR